MCGGSALIEVGFGCSACVIRRRVRKVRLCAPIKWVRVWQRGEMMGLAGQILIFGAWIVLTTVTQSLKFLL